ncbi:NAD-dependent epimerase/dehydratase family protein [Actinospica sp.]|uniref:NAD-dependent epimerase/dehydratase family protein n=1 Tax=Actinospica sp. TaxID=1872142 RepID=UPI002C889D83|nr:NAD-dependent epimerase/dehydratase family protein [Actinospica sp.]HWG26022.1 NAD-dependent epimerase/dehydratase family protein [Actinospica sp.]
MKVLVTGAAGTLGREVVRHLRSRGWTVRADDRVPLDPGEADEVSSGDLLDPERVRGIVAGMSAVVHAAAIPAPMLGSEQEIFSNNVMSAYQVLDAAGRAGVPRIAYISSLSALGFAYSAHGISPESFPVTEEHPCLAEDVYGLSKSLGEGIARTVALRWGSTVVSLRFPFLGHGERLRHHLDYVQADPRNDSRGLWAWLDTRDAARAIEAALTRPLTGHHVVQVVADDSTSPVPTAELLRGYHPNSVLTEPIKGCDTTFSTVRSRELLDFTAIHGWRDLAGEE